MTERWVTIYNAEDAVEAHAFQDYLEAHEVETRALPHPDPQLAGAPVSPGWGRIQVPQPKEAEARELLRGWLEAPPKLIVETRERVASVQRATAAGLTHRTPSWAQDRREPPWVWWILMVSLVANAVLATLLFTKAG